MFERVARVFAAGLAVFGLLACSAGSTDVSSRASASVAVSPGQGFQGDKLTLSGSGWSGEDPVDLTLIPAGQASQDNSRAINLGRVAADAQGRFSFITIVPSTARPGVWNVSARGSVSTTQSASAPFTVLQSSLTPSGAPVSATPNTATALPSSTPRPSPAATQTPAPTPQPPTHTPVPPTQPPPTQPPGPSLTGLLRGNTLQVRGDGWNAGQRVTVSVSRNKDGSRASKLGEPRVDSKGHLEYSPKLPKGWRSPTYVVVSDQNHRVIVPVQKADD